MKLALSISCSYRLSNWMLLICIFTQAIFLQANEEPRKLAFEPELFRLGSDKEILERFFRIMIEDSEAGYVLFGEKPICFNSYPKHDIDIWGTPSHIENTILREGARVWKKHRSKLASNSNYLLIVGETSWNTKDKYLPILFINKSALIKCLKENLSLFQYILGPTINPEKLINRILDSKEHLFSILKYNKVLIGIVLGFGTQNALFGSRLEYLHESVFMPVQVPFKQSEEIGALNQEQLLSIDYTHGPNEYFIHHNLQPSDGYQSIREENDDLENLLTISSPILSTRKPKFIFGGLKNNAENLLLIERLEKEQKKIIKVIESENFLEQVFAKLKPSFDEPLISSLNFPVESLADILAKHVWKRMEDDNLVGEYQIDQFIKGMEASKKANLDFDEIMDAYSTAFASFYNSKKTFEVQKKYEKLEKFFEELSKDINNQCIIPSKLYYRTVSPGNQKTLSNSDHRVLLHYRLTTLDGNEICNTYASGKPKWIDLMDTIPGFNNGLNGMQINEIRRIYIHPDFGYGAYTSRFEKGACLIATVQLMDKESNKFDDGFQKKSTAQSHDKISPISEKDFFKAQNAYIYNLGFIFGNHYKKIGSILNLEKVSENLKRFVKKEYEILPLNLEQEQILNYLNFIIYTNSGVDSL